MASLQDIRRRITSVRNTRKITKALELVAGARLRRAQSRMEEMRPYADRMQELMVGTARAAASFRNLALMQRRDDVRRVAIVVVAGDRGLAGPFNGQVLRRAFELEREVRADGQEPLWLVVGRKGASTLRFRRYELAGQWAGFSDKPTYGDAQGIAHNSSYLVWYEVARIEYHARFRSGYKGIQADGYEALTTETHVRYLKPVFFDDRIKINARISEVRGARFRYEYVLERDGETVADGWTQHAVVDRVTFRPTRLPDWLVEEIEKAER